MVTAVDSGAAFLEPTFKRAARIWWAWCWRSLIFGLAGAVFGSLVLSISGVLNHISEKAGQFLGLALGVLVGVPVGIWVFQMILEKDFGDFRIRLLPKPPGEPLPKA